MEMRYLGKTGLKVSELCLGAMTFGRPEDTSEEDSFKMMDMFAEAGGNFIDTANVYTRGVSESIVGKWLQKQNRYDWIVATKVRFPMGEGPNDLGLSRKHILAAVEDSLTRLQTDHIDLYQVHCWDYGTSIEETLSTLNGLVQSGKLRYIGISNYKAHQMQKAIDVSKAMGWEPFISLQPLYNLLDRSLEWEIVEFCIDNGLGIIPWSPLRGGWLSGKYSRDMENPPEDTRAARGEKGGWGERWSAYNNDRTWDVLDTLKAVAEEVGKSPAQVALNWVKDQLGVTAPIIGARKISHLEDNLGSIGWSLSDEQRERLSEVSEMPGPYPYDFVANGNTPRLRS